MPAMLIFGFTAVRLYIPAFVVFAFFLWLSMRFRIFREWANWPSIARVAVTCSPVLLIIIFAISRLSEDHVWKSAGIAIAYGVFSVFASYSLLNKCPPHN